MRQVYGQGELSTPRVRQLFQLPLASEDNDR
jgi:hypothetical protein